MVLRAGFWAGKMWPPRMCKLIWSSGASRTNRPVEGTRTPYQRRSLPIQNWLKYHTSHNQTYGVIVVPNIIGEIGFDSGSILLEYRSDHKCRTPQELFIQCPCHRVFGVFVIQRSNDSRALGVAVVKQRVKVRQETVANHKSFACGVGNAVPRCGVLLGAVFVVMTATERVKRAQFNPTLAHLLRCFADEPTDVSTVVRYAKHVELKHSCQQSQSNHSTFRVFLDWYRW